MFVFLDYDGTLIKTKEEIFQENYFKKFLKHTGIKDNNIIRIILECTSELVKSTEEKENNLAFFMEKLSEKAGNTSEYWYNLFMEFYESEFSSLKTVIEPNYELLEAVKSSDEKFIFASNPVFPQIAVRKRMDFIDMKEEDFLYVSFMENSKYCKPNKEYFEEVLNKLNIKSSECVMIGDTDFDKASVNAGIRFIHVDDEENWKKILKKR
ncbi:MAG TPA: HAD hydrolase-like protein [Tepiditoga sp.]|nr:HAD family hydrolase [Thermotogota bacterium]HOO74735.1 HAD hydrolase-like protein [Tepiditoga sp.]